MSQRLATLDQPGALAGLIFIAIGSLGLIASSNLAFGTPAMMGSGFMPRILAISILIVGLVVLLRAFLSARSEAIGRVNFRAVCLVLVAVAGFAILNSYLGYLAAATFLITVSAMARPGRRLVETAALVAILCLVTTLIFIVGLGVQLRLF